MNFRDTYPYGLECPNCGGVSKAYPRSSRTSTPTCPSCDVRFNIKIIPVTSCTYGLDDVQVSDGDAWQQADTKWGSRYWLGGEDPGTPVDNMICRWLEGLEEETLDTAHLISAMGPGTAPGLPVNYEKSYENIWHTPTAFYVALHPEDTWWDTKNVVIGVKSHSGINMGLVVEPGKMEELDTGFIVEYDRRYVVFAESASLSLLRVMNKL